MSLHGDKANFLSKHLNSNYFNFANFDIFGGILYFCDIIGKFFRDGYFLYDAVFDMLMSKHWNDSFLDGEFKGFYHEIK